MCGTPECLTILNQRLDEWHVAHPPGAAKGVDGNALASHICNLARVLSMPGIIPDRRAGSMREALAFRVRALAQRIETALQGNHLIRYGKALLAAGLAFSGEEADAWFRHGLALLDREIDIQVFRDGGHADRSPMYQMMVFLDFLEALSLARAAGSRAGEGWVPKLSRMALFLDACHHPDGLPALLGDTSYAGLPAKRQLMSFARELGIRPDLLHRRAMQLFPDSLYAVARDLSRGNYLILDTGADGDTLDAAHYHCQAFSYELSLDGRRIITDTGVFTLEAGRERTPGRSTAAHNSVSWKGRELSEIEERSGVGRRAQITGRNLRRTAGGVLRFSGGLQGYYPGIERGSWQRRLLWSYQGILEVADDWLHPRDAAGVVSRIHFAPGLALVAAGRGNWDIRLLHGPAIASVRVSAGEATVGTSPYHPSFGETVERACLEIALISNTAAYRLLPLA